MLTFSGDATRSPTPERPARKRFESFIRVCAVLGALAIAGCATPPPPPPPLPPPPPPAAPPPVVQAPSLPQRNDQANYFRLRGTPRGVTPVRVVMLLPFSNPSAETRGVAQALQRAAELALFDSRNANIILLPRDDGGSAERAAAAAARAIEDGAEVILGPLFAQSAAAVRPVARRLGVPVISFSTDRSVGGDGVYLLSFQPETEVQRVVSYAARNGHSDFAALVPQTGYGELVGDAFRDAVMRSGGRVTTVQSFPARGDGLAAPARQVAGTQPDAVLIGDGGQNLRALGSSLAISSGNRTKLLGIGQWNDPTIQREPSLVGGWFAAPAPEGWNRFVARYRGLYNAAPPRIASLGYDAMSLVTLLSRGQPYRRYTPAALTDPNGFTGIDGIFRFRADGSVDRGLAVLQVRENGFTVVEPAPRSFQGAGG